MTKPRLLLPALALTGLLALSVFRRKRTSFRGRVAVIAGASRGLGLALARELAQEGAILHLLARDQAELERAATPLRARGATVEIWPCDIRDKPHIEQILTTIGEKDGIDLLINNAGIIVVSPFENLTEEDFGDAMNTHFWGPLLAINAALPYLKKSSGHIVNISSIGGQLAVPHLSAYCASKFALVGLSSSLRAELASSGVRVTTVCPGLMRTGSYIHAKFKGDPDREFSWFSLASSLPFLSIGAERAARQILAAARSGRAQLTITTQARMAVIAQALLPGFVSTALAFVHRFLPAGPVRDLHSGEECSAPPAVSSLTVLGRRASVRLNELPAPEAAA